jgi:hypothetical protein
MDLDSAIQNLKIWDILFRNAIHEKGALDETPIELDDCCQFGRWLYGEGRAQYGKLSSFDRCLLDHAKFHSEAGTVLEAMDAGKVEEVKKMLSHESTYAKALNKVVSAILDLKKEADQNP